RQVSPHQDAVARQGCRPHRTLDGLEPAVEEGRERLLARGAVGDCPGLRRAAERVEHPLAVAARLPVDDADVRLPVTLAPDHHPPAPEPIGALVDRALAGTAL